LNALRRAVYAVWLYGWTVILLFVLIPTQLMPPRVILGGVRLWARVGTWGLRWIGGVRTVVEGLEHLPPGGCLVAAKHQSMFDILPPFAFLPGASFVMKKELMRIPLFGWHCRHAGMIEVDREGHAKALKDLVAQVSRRIGEGRQVVIFPEGTRQAPGAPPNYKPGVAALYRELDAPCVPMAANVGDCLTSWGLVKRPGVIVFQLLEPIRPGLKRGEFMRQLEERIETASDALRQRNAP
jgi:1-acyl-sn-glycerol-3-phosphate acyltransferase